MIGQTVFACAVMLGIVGVLLGSRTALWLLCGTGLQLALAVLGVPFNVALWMLIDVVVIVAIATPPMRVADCLIIALFVPGWGTYFVNGWTGYDLSVAVCAAQFLLAFPWVKAWRRVRHAELKFDPWRDFDLRVKHG